MDPRLTQTRKLTLKGVHYANFFVWLIMVYYYTHIFLILGYTCIRVHSHLAQLLRTVLKHD